MKGIKKTGNLLAFTITIILCFDSCGTNNSPQKNDLPTDNLKQVIDSGSPVNTSSDTIEYEDLTDLSTYESLKFDEFKLNYDDKVLLGLKPISICKMFLHASLIKDYDTEYELYTTNGEGFFISKEEYMNIPINERMSDFTVVEDVHNLKVEINKYDKEYATIIWNSKNGYSDEK